MWKRCKKVIEKPLTVKLKTAIYLFIVICYLLIYEFLLNQERICEDGKYRKVDFILFVMNVYVKCFIFTSIRVQL